MRTVFHKIRRIFLAGLLVSLPLVITIVVFKFAFETLDNLLGPLITRLLIELGVPIVQTFQVPGLGVIATLAIVFFIGLFTTNFVGRKTLKIGEWVVTQIPVIRSVYSGAKQIIDTIAAGGSSNFSKVALVEYPRKGLYCLAFITGETRGEAQKLVGDDLINIFLPTTPNPTSGFYLMAKREDLIEMDMTVEDGVKMLMSGGLVTPNGPQKPESDKPAITTPTKPLPDGRE